MVTVDVIESEGVVFWGFHTIEDHSVFVDVGGNKGLVSGWFMDGTEVAIGDLG